MNKYADYEFYKIDYCGNLSDELFNSYIVKASKDIERNINRPLNQDVFDELEPDVREKISYVACLLCDYYDNYGDLTASGRPNSVSIDGVSISSNSYSVDTENANKKLKTIYENLPKDWINYL